MPSPFPGMNPYFEQSAHWQDFHTEFLTVLRRQLAPTIAPSDIIQLEEQVYIHDVPRELRILLGRDYHRDVEPERVPFLEIRERRGRALVTVIWLFSSSIKRGGAVREQYLAKRSELLQGSVQLVAIDLLRGWAPMPPENRPECDYSVLMSRADGRSSVDDFWPLSLRDPLPCIPIPLRPAHKGGLVALQQVLHGTYDGPGYEHFIYAGEPEPPISGEDASWARQFLPQSG